MGAEALSGAGGARPRRTGRPGTGQTKSGKPRPGTGGNGRRALEGKGPTPPAAMRPGHPAQRRAGAPDASRTQRRDDGPGAPRTPGAFRTSGFSGPGASGSSGRPARGAGDVAEFVAGRNSVLEALRAAVPAAVLYVGSRLQHDERVSEAIKLAADRGIVVLEAGGAADA